MIGAIEASIVKKHHGRVRDWPPKWERLAVACGGVDELAARLETTRRVVDRWVRGREPQGPTRVAIRYLAREVGVGVPV
jgi:hypothetical protein